jgi:hypothetical protein
MNESRRFDIDLFIVRICFQTNPVTFSVLFCEAIQRYHMIVLGIYRLLDVLISQDPSKHAKPMTGGHKRIVICYPPYNYHMDPSDMVCSLIFELVESFIRCLFN